MFNARNTKASAAASGHVTRPVYTAQFNAANVDTSPMYVRYKTALTLLLTAGWVLLGLQHRHIHPHCSCSIAAAAAAAAACTWLVLMWQRCTDALPWRNSTRL
jgi:hypothetical protein